MLTPTDVIETLLALVAPHCSGCHRPATTYRRAVQTVHEIDGGGQGAALSEYRCDEHPGEGKWQTMPGAAAIRAATALVEAERG